VLRKQQLNVGLSGSSNLRAVGADNHTVKNVVIAGGDKLLGPLDLNDAHAAAADFIYVLEIAQGGDVDPDGGRGLQDRRVGRNLNDLIVDRNLYHWSILPPRNEPNPK